MSDPHPITGRPFASPVLPGTGWPGDPATATTPVALDAADVVRLAASASLDELQARSSVCRACPRLVSWRESMATLGRRASFADLVAQPVTERGYEFASNGQGQWNGVALLSKVGLTDVERGFPDMPGFPDPEARAISADCGGIRVHSLYVPNGRVPDSDHYRYKLDWLAALRASVAAGPQRVALCGDLNIAPADADVFDPGAYIGQTHVTAPERSALQGLLDLGLRDVVRDRWPTQRVFSYWDYRAGMFHQDLGMRIDLVLADAATASRVAAAWIDRQARKGTGPSDHAPVTVDLDEAPDGDIGPMVPPPSAPRTSRRGSRTLPQSR